MSEGDDVYGGESSWMKERVLEDWSASLEHAKGKLFVGRVKARVAFLEEEVLSVVKSVGSYLVFKIHQTSCQLICG